MYITHESGHHRATLAIERAISELSPNSKVLNIDGFGYAHPVMEKVTHAIYMSIIKRTPKIWDYLYDNHSIAKKINGFKDSVNKNNLDKMKKLIVGENCKVVVCSQAFPCGMVSYYKKHYSADIKIIAVVTDYMPHSYWIYDEIDYYVVGSEIAKIRLVSKGVPENKIKLFGIPIDSKFSLELDRDMVLKELNIASDKPLILIMGGGRGIGPIKSLVMALDESELNAHLLVVAGINKSLFNYFKKFSFRKKVYIYGHINFIDKLMTISDILITKPGGVTAAEALAKKLPMLIIKPLPGQEQRNTDFLLKEGVVQKADSIEEAINKLNFLLCNREEMSRIREKASYIAKPFSSLDIAKLALNLC